MRLNAKDWRARFYVVYLDGEPLPDCVEADDEAGYALCPKRDRHGRLQGTLGRPELIRLEGRVEFVRTGD